MPPLFIFLIQLILVLSVAHGAGWIAQRLRQPRVVGEMAAGILLGPSLLGQVAPGLSAAVLGPELLGGLGALSQLGLLLFVFLVGMEIQPDQLRRKGGAAVAISAASIVLPAGLGVAAGLALAPQQADPGVPPLHFALFLGVALSITAFPVLARILVERGLLRTPLGALAIACAAADDLLAWCMLAIVVVLINAAGAETPLWLMLGGSAAYCASMLTLGRAALARLIAPPSGGDPAARPPSPQRPLSHMQLAGVLIMVAASAAVTEWLGIHALFGAFLAGAIMPRDAGLLRQIRARLEDLTVVLLLPLFFAAVGLRTDIGLLDGGASWLAAGLILAAAVAGKLIGATGAARLAGLPWAEALSMGALMNTRGLMELVVAGIGLEIGVINGEVFTVLVLVALVTTCMTGPLLDVIAIGHTK